MGDLAPECERSMGIFFAVTHLNLSQVTTIVNFHFPIVTYERSLLCFFFFWTLLWTDFYFAAMLSFRTSFQKICGLRLEMEIDICTFGKRKYSTGRI